MNSLWLKKMVRRTLSDRVVDRIKERLHMSGAERTKREVDALYRTLYHAVHDPDSALDITAGQTEMAFSRQWDEIPEGQYMLSDSWFRRNIQGILCDELVLLRPEWFRGKRVLDAGCGGGRWSYALASLGSRLTYVDINDSALAATHEALLPLDIEAEAVKSPLESLDSALRDRSFDMVFSYGVLHHCKSYHEAFDSVVGSVKDGGVLFLYLYGRESLNMQEDLKLFKDRVYYNSLTSEDERVEFLLSRVGGRKEYLHQMHDLYAPLINRRLEFDQVRGRLEVAGFCDVERTIDHTELFVRAFKGKGAKEQYEKYLLPPAKAPYWFDHYR